MKPEDKITHIMINASVLMNRLHDPIADNIFKFQLKNKAKLFLKELRKLNTIWFEPLLDQSKDVEYTALTVYDVYDEFITECATVEIQDMQNLTAVIKAYKADNKSIEGIVNKILKNIN